MSVKILVTTTIHSMLMEILRKEVQPKDPKRSRRMKAYLFWMQPEYYRKSSFPRMYLCWTRHGRILRRSSTRFTKRG